MWWKSLVEMRSNFISVVLAARVASSALDLAGICGLPLVKSCHLKKTVSGVQDSLEKHLATLESWFGGLVIKGIYYACRRP